MNLKITLKMVSVLEKTKEAFRNENKQLDFFLPNLSKIQVQSIVKSFNNIISSYDKTYKIKTDYSIQQLQFEHYDNDSNILELFPESSNSDVYDESDTIDMFQEDKEEEIEKAPDSIDSLEIISGDRSVVLTGGSAKINETLEKVANLTKEEVIALNNDCLADSDSVMFVSTLIARVNTLLSKDLPEIDNNSLLYFLDKITDIRSKLMRKEYKKEQFTLDLNKFFPDYLAYIESLEKEIGIPVKEVTLLK